MSRHLPFFYPVNWVAIGGHFKTLNSNLYGDLLKSHTDASQGLVSPVWGILHQFFGDTVLRGRCVIFNVELKSGPHDAADDLFFGIRILDVKVQMIYKIDRSTLISWYALDICTPGAISGDF